MDASISRRGFLQASGALVVSFTLLSRTFDSVAAERELPGSLKNTPYLDAWLRIDADGTITVFTGKAELGQGIKTALIQIAAEELAVLPPTIQLVTADTGRTPNEGYTAGSHSLQDSGAAIRNAAAQAREILLAEAARRWLLDPAQLTARSGQIVSENGHAAKYAELVSGQTLHVMAQPQSKLKDPHDFVVMGTPMKRVDIPAKVTGGMAYVHDLRLPNMVHARVVRPSSPAAELLSVDTAAVERMPGVLKVVRDGRFLAVIAEGEWQAVQAMRKLSAAARWREQGTLPAARELPKVLQSMKAEDAVVADEQLTAPPAKPVRTFEATYTRPYQCHASIGPSCAVAHLENGSLTVWTHTQGVYPDRAAIAEMLNLPQEKVRCIHMEGSGCYGHNGADDAAADAALLARAFPGRPVRVQWMREQEHAWEPYGPAMVTKVRATLNEKGKIGRWNYELWSNTHATRPGPAGNLLAARHLAMPFEPAPQSVRITPEGSGDRNAVPLYAFPNKHIVWHFLREMPLRVSALRSLGAYMNVFSIESFMDELATAAAVDPVDFRLDHLEDARAREVVTTAAQRFGWSTKAMPTNRGRGFAFARYKNLAAYCAVAVEVQIEPDSGRVRMLRAVAAVDSGEIVNPDGIRNQIEGGILQAMSWTLYEAVTFDDTRITSIDWSTYPILRFPSVPDSIDVHVIPRPGEPFLGTGEAAQGPAAAALANAIANATGKRLRDLPFTRERVRTAVTSAPT
ncbi:MAG TPA: molybdopterin cofactor-binding domain-containing protein [Steroidobacteraceae bacterium]|nr:molybdopterin cofactor-binding domain-containing protein [Steroidobacteraceae bacterium]